MSNPMTLRDLLAAGTARPWLAEVDLFDEDGNICASVGDAGVNALFISETDVAPHRGFDPTGQWTEQDSAERDARWRAARETQEFRDAQLICAAVNALPALLDEVEVLREDLAETKLFWHAAAKERDTALRDLEAVRVELAQSRIELVATRQERDDARAQVSRLIQSFDSENK